jgi:hypothetical protein
MSFLKVRKRFYLPILIFLIVGYTSASLSSDIEVYHVYKILPVFVIYTDLDKGICGEAKSLLVFIDRKSRNYNDILNHELIHAKQAYRYCFQNWIPLLLSDSFLVKMEAEAYSPSISRIEDIPIWAKMIHELYPNSVEVEDVENYLVYYWTKYNL